MEHHDSDSPASSESPAPHFPIGGSTPMSTAMSQMPGMMPQSQMPPGMMPQYSNMYPQWYGMMPQMPERHLHSTVLPDERILNVIVTPGLFDSTVESNTMAKEIAHCITLAKDGIHAVLLILSLRSLFSQEEASAFECLCQIFGPKKLTLDDFLANNQLKNTRVGIELLCLIIGQKMKTRSVGRGRSFSLL
ncbi:immune-associated nucleotide-binding protein 8-like [Salvia splendens]|uniref:immune-associated nucleotide-binding protein 8-like n=1 Tax=Salvia splendens TaxID=180675 RepID=UPI001C25A39E|nr:immune-associated nucleotide-binding protein 8-like [Salvia splendens]